MIEQRVRALEVQVELIDRRLQNMEKRLWTLGLVVAGLCNVMQVIGWTF